MASFWESIIRMIYDIGIKICRIEKRVVRDGPYIVFTCFKKTKELQEWFNGTVLTEFYPEAAPFLTPQHIWNHFQYFNEMKLQEVFLRILKQVKTIYGPSLTTFLLDSTNFYTYIVDHPNNTLPKRGHGKEGKKHLNIVNFALLLDEAKECPLFYKSYPGNVPDSEHIKTFLPEMRSMVQEIGPRLTKARDYARI